MNQDNKRRNTYQFKAFKGIYVAADHIYYLCDFYRRPGEEYETEYNVVIETPQHQKTQHRFTYKKTAKCWMCENPEELSAELIEKIITEIIKLEVQ